MAPVPSKRVGVIARKLISFHWRPTATRPYIHRASDEPPHQINGKVWDAMREILGQPQVQDERNDGGGATLDRPPSGEGIR